MTSKIEQMVRKCFCYDCEFAIAFINDGNPLPCKTLCGPYIQNWQHLARAARRFCKMEQREKLKRFVEECKKHSKYPIKLPKHFGEMRRGK